MPDGIPDIDESVLNVEDDSEDDTKLLSALKLYVAGIGQCGGNIASAFYELGHRKVIAVNTNSQDMARIKIPAKNRLIIGDDDEGGAAGDITRGRAIAEKYSDHIRKHMKRFVGKRHVDYGLICASAGGGTGPGGFKVMVTNMRETLAPFKREGEPNVGAILALPSSGEDPHVKANAYHTLMEALEMVDAGELSPLILLDNAKMQTLEGVNVVNFKPKINQKIAQHITRFNHVAALDGGLWQFDKADWRSIFTSGVVTFAVTPVPNYAEVGGIKKTMKAKLAETVLLDVPNYKTSTKAGCICVGSEEILGSIAPTEMEDGFEAFGSMLADDYRIFRGIYITEADNEEKGMVVNSVIGNLGRPTQYLDRLKEAGHVKA